MAEVAQLKARFSAEGVDSTIGGIRRVEGAVQHTHGVVGKLGQTLTFAAGSLLGGGIASIARGIGGMASGALDFSAQMANVNSIAQLTDAELSKLSDKVLALAGDPAITQGPAELAAGLYDIASAGITGQDGIAVLTLAAKDATAGMSDTATAADALTNVMGAYGLQASDAASISDILFQTVNDGKLSFPELASNMGEVLPTAASMGVGLDQVGAAMATMTLQGIDASQGQTALNALLLSAIHPTEALSGALKAHGMASAQDIIQTQGLSGYFAALNTISKDTGLSMFELTGDVRANKAALALASGDAETYNKELKNMDAASKGAGATQKALDKQMKSGRYGLQQISKETAIFAATIEKRLDPTINKLGVGISKVIGDLTTGDFGGALDALTQVVSIGIDVAVGAIHLAESAATDVATWLNDHFHLKDVTKEVNIDAKTGVVSWATSVDWGALASDLAAVAFGNIAKWLGGGANIGDGTAIGSPSLINMALTPDGHWDPNANWPLIAAKMLADADKKLSDALGLSTTDADIAKSEAAGKVAGDKFATRVFAGFKAGVDEKSKDDGSGEGPDHSLHGLKAAFFTVMNYNPLLGYTGRPRIIDNVFAFAVGIASGIQSAIGRGLGILTAQSLTNAAGISQKIAQWLNTTADGLTNAPTRLVNWLRNLPTTIMNAVGALKIEIPLPSLPPWLTDPLSIFGEASGIAGVFQHAAGGGGGPAAAISGFIKAIPGEVLAAVGTLKISIPTPTLPGWMTEFIGFSISTGKAVTGIAGKIKAIPGDILTAVGTLSIDIPTPTLPDWLTDLGWITDRIDAFKKAFTDLQFWQHRADDAAGTPRQNQPAPADNTNTGGASNETGLVGNELVNTLPDTGTGTAPPPVMMKFLADDSDVHAKWAEAMTWAGIWASQIPTAHLNADNSQAGMQYEGAISYGNDWASRTFTGLFNGDNSQAGKQWEGAVSYGDDWASQIFTGLFNGDNSGAGMQYEGAMSYGYSWASQVFTASFSVDVSGLWYASAVADQVASHIAAVMPHSPAREGPLREPIRFDYIGENFAGVMGRIKGIAHGGASAVAKMGGASAWHSGAVPWPHGTGGGVVHNHYYLDGAILGPAATRWIQDEIALGAVKPVNRGISARQMAGSRA